MTFIKSNKSSFINLFSPSLFSIFKNKMYTLAGSLFWGILSVNIHIQKILPTNSILVII